MSDNSILSKTYEPKEVENRWYRFWLEKEYFKADAGAAGPAYCIVLPPPNVTGSLHLGHALTATLQDILIRWKRMSGYNTLWLPGIDHAGIATQMVVERELRKENLTRHDLGREEFLKRVWQWKETNGQRIAEQHKALGASLDWSRERFTMDPGLCKAVREAFVRLYEEGLIYRDMRLINWCPRCQTALSDLEVEHEEMAGHLYHIAYPVKDSDKRLIVATTRPETMLGDTAVAVHPEDERYLDVVNALVVLPIVKRHIPVIGDTYVDRDFGTGALKVTPGHDFNDYEIGQRHGLEKLSIFDREGRLNEAAGAFIGEDRFVAREKIVARLKEDGLLLEVEDYAHSIGHCQRCRTIVEPTLSRQWFVSTESLAKPALEAVKSGQTKIIPEMRAKTYYHWMENIQDWCISRQLWWGHQIPAWYCDDCGGITVSRDDPLKCASCGSQQLRQEEDVLDTWFSSGLWPFSTLGWPDKTADLQAYYPNAVMETGYDILFFWVARMMMMGMKMMGEPPFAAIYLHAMVRDEHGRKMSKTTGNVIDPLEVTAEYGADAMRFTFATLAGQGQDIKLSLQRVKGYRFFLNKIWNAARFALSNLQDYQQEGPDDDMKSATLADRWILSRLRRANIEVVKALEKYRFFEAAQVLYHFFWHEFCDWYIELSKPVLYQLEEQEKRRATQQVLALVLDRSLKLLHPFVPHITEEIWQRLPRGEGALKSIVVSAFPDFENRGDIDDPAAEEAMGLIQEATVAIRTIRSETNIPPGARIEVKMMAADEKLRSILLENSAYITYLARLGNIEILSGGERPSGSAAAVVQGAEIFVPLAGLVDFDEEIQRLSKAIAKIEADCKNVEKKLGNPKFLERAPAEIIEKEKDRLHEIKEKKAKLTRNLGRLQESRI